MKRLIAFLLITICLTVSIAAQSSNQTKVSGSVKDPADAAVAGARIFLLNTKTRMEETTVNLRKSWSKRKTETKTDGLHLLM